MKLIFLSMLNLGVHSLFIFGTVIAANAQNCKTSCILGPSCLKTCENTFSACILATMHMIKMYQCQKCKINCNVCCRGVSMDTVEQMIDGVERNVERQKQSYSFRKQYLRESIPMFLLSSGLKNRNSRQIIEKA